jgi:hypothetical protein
VICPVEGESASSQPSVSDARICKPNGTSQSISFFVTGKPGDERLDSDASFQNIISTPLSHSHLDRDSPFASVVLVPTTLLATSFLLCYDITCERGKRPEQRNRSLPFCSSTPWVSLITLYSLTLPSTPVTKKKNYHEALCSRPRCSPLISICLRRRDLHTHVRLRI